MSLTNIYVLQLEGGKYYVGKSGDVLNRYQQHLNGSGSAWTKKYQPISLVETKESVSPFEEDMVTKEYMAKYGIDAVRGGSYVEMELSEFHKDALKMEIWGAKDLCTQCGRAGHFVKDCRATTDASGNKIEFEDEWACEYCHKRYTTKLACTVHEKSCKHVSQKTTVVTHTTSKGSCYRCGRPGHYSPDCYASRHLNGSYLESDDSDYDSD